MEARGRDLFPPSPRTPPKAWIALYEPANPSIIHACKGSFSRTFRICKNRPTIALMSNQSPTRSRRLIGYARVSTEEQVNDSQVDALRTAGCHIVHQEHGSGASRSRPV